MRTIAIDGFMGCGKSGLAKILAKELGFKMLETGAIFRALAYGFLQQEGAGEGSNALQKREVDENKLKNFVQKAKVEIAFSEDGQHTILSGVDVTPFLRTEQVSQMASKISVFPFVREKYVQIAREFVRKNDCVMEGRDIGSVIVPNADVKFFLTADEKVRAKRRYMDLKKTNKSVKLADVLADLRERDLRDSTRELAPVKPCDDSVIVDDTDMTLRETADYCLQVIREKLPLHNVVNVTIDGYVCSGKSTIAKALARRLGFKVFDTGAVYRAIACAFDYMNLDENKISEKYIQKFANQINLEVQFVDGTQHMIVNGIDHTAGLRTERISALSAKISPFQCIREKVLEIQRSFAAKNNLVMEGRDIGSYVLPNANFKFFCLADENVRAKRRFEQQRAMGNDVQFDDVLKELQERDFADENREHGAITKTPESIIIDTTNQSLDQSVDFCINEMEKRWFKFSKK